MVLAISAAIALDLSLISLGTGMRDSTAKALERVDADLYVLPEGLNPLFRDLQRFDQTWSVMSELEGSPAEIDRMSPRLKDSLMVDLNGGSFLEVLALGVVPDKESAFGQYVVRDGEWFPTGNDPVKELSLSDSEVEQEALTKECLLTVQLARRLSVDIGDDIRITSSGSSNALSYTVAGTYIDHLSGRSEEMMLHLGELQYLKGLLQNDTCTEILVSMEAEEGVGRILEWSRSVDFRFKDIVELHTRDDILGELYDFTRIIQGFSNVVIVITSIVSIAFVSTMFMVSSKARERELALLRALGSPRSSVIREVMGSSVAVSLVGGTLGLVLGLVLNSILNRLSEEAISALPPYFTLFQVDTYVIVSTVILSLAIGIGSGIVPALAATLRSPVSCLRGVEA